MLKPNATSIAREGRKDPRFSGRMDRISTMPRAFGSEKDRAAAAFDCARAIVADLDKKGRIDPAAIPAPEWVQAAALILQGET
jgi:hypothetical protein